MNNNNNNNDNDISYKFCVCISMRDRVCNLVQICNFSFCKFRFQHIYATLLHVNNLFKFGKVIFSFACGTCF